MDPFLYQGEHTNQISFPLGGIGTGCIGLAGNGRLIDWEIFNRPNKGSVNGFSHFAIKAENRDEVVDARILHGNLAAPYQGELHGGKFGTFGWGPRREYLTGLPHFAAVDFTGKFPIAELDFIDDSFPGKVRLTAFNPFIPTDADDSGLPAAFFEFEVQNPTEEELTYSLVGVLSNPLAKPTRNQVETTPWGTVLKLSGEGAQPDAPAFGEMALATDAGKFGVMEVSWQEYWFRGTWFDNLEIYWKDLETPGPFANRTYADAAPRGHGARLDDQDSGLLAVRFTAPPGSSRQVRFVISWNFPNCEDYWHPEEDRGTWKNHYATRWSSAIDTARYALEDWSRLHMVTDTFRGALFGSTLPPVALDAVSANLAILKSPTALRLEDGTFYGWEGLHPDEGCCEGSCTHVWNYQQALAFLFPELERSMRTADYRYNLQPDGGMPFRIQLPLGTAPWNFRPCSDGQLGGVMKTYRDWKICGDDDWLRELWPSVRRSLEYAWSEQNPDRWDPERSGVLTGRQHHTLDMELFGPNAWLTGFYLGALKAASEMARHLGEDGFADDCLAMFEKGKTWVDEHLFNGEFYIQQVDLGNRALLAGFGDTDDTLRGGSALEAYWNSEHEEIKYQIGEGSSIDQVLGQWHASLYGLGDLFDPGQVKSACAAIHRHNFIPDMSRVYNPCRIYCLNDEGGLVICAWPEDAYKPLIPAPYSQETMNGFEYAAATHMIMVGLVAEGLQCIQAIRDRYDGAKRNPWNEFECGNNYARSMASYALLNAYSGFRFDMSTGLVGFNPVDGAPSPFRCFWSLDQGWGQVEIDSEGCRLSVLHGELPLRHLQVPCFADLDNPTVILLRDDVERIACERTGDQLTLETEITIGIAQSVLVRDM